MKAVVAAFNQEKALVGAFSAITNLRMELFQALVCVHLYQVADDEVGAGRHPEAVPVHDLRRHPAAVQPGADRPPALDTDTADCRQ